MACHDIPSARAWCTWAASALPQGVAARRRRSGRQRGRGCRALVPGAATRWSPCQLKLTEKPLSSFVRSSVLTNEGHRPMGLIAAGPSPGPERQRGAEWFAEDRVDRYDGRVAGGVGLRQRLGDCERRQHARLDHPNVAGECACRHQGEHSSVNLRVDDAGVRQFIGHRLRNRPDVAYVRPQQRKVPGKRHSSADRVHLSRSMRSASSYRWVR